MAGPGVPAALAAVALATAAAGSLGAWRQRRSTARLVETVVQAPPDEPVQPVAFRTLDGLPDPVARYLRHVLRDGQARIRVARLRQRGELRTDFRSQRWLGFEADHTAAAGPPGFVWDARVRVAPLLHLRVRDAYVGGRGSGRVSLLSAVTVAAAAGRPEIDAGSLHRYLAEAVWYPTALLPGDALRWTPIDATRALATLTDANTTVSLEFRFDDAGEVAGIFTPGRWGAFPGGYALVPWEGRLGDYRLCDGLRVPHAAEVGWHAAGAWQCVWRGEVAGASYEFLR